MTQDEQTRPVVGPSGRKIIYDKDGKPCRSCNTLLDFKMANLGSKPPTKPSDTSSNTKSSVSASGAVAAATATATAVDATTSKTSTSTSTPSSYPKDCPPDVTELGRSSWTLLHSIAARYPETPSEAEQSRMFSFINLFAQVYPCWFCADDFQKYIQREETKPKVKTQEEFGKWLCEAHNEVNVKLGKPKFDCNLWKQRWKDGWKDGSCD